MKRFLFLLFSSLPFIVAAQSYPTVTSSLSYAKTQTTHGLSVGEWLTIDDSGVIVKGSEPSSQPFIGIVSKVVNANVFEYAPPGGPITLSGLTAGEIYYAQADGTIAPISTASDTSKPVLKSTSTTQGILYSGSFGAVSLPPPINGSPPISVSSVTASSFSLSVIPVSSGGLMAVVSESPISWTPSGNVSYESSVNTVFGSGNDVSGGDGVYVVIFDETGSAVITGLDPATTYYVVGFEFVNQGNLYSYSTGNDANLTTLQDVTTPTTQFDTTSIISKRTQLRIIGERGNGDNIVVIASTEGQPDTDLADGVNPTSGSYGVGTAAGNGYVVYEGASDDFSIRGFTSDQMVWFKIMEREDTGFLYNTQADIDSVWTAWAYDSLFIQSAQPAGQTYLEASSEVFYDFTKLTGSSGATISNGDAGLVDYGPGAYTATVISTPQVEDATISSQTVKTLEAVSGVAVSTGHDGVDWMQGNNFEIILGILHQDGQHAGENNYIGVTSTDFGSRIRLYSNGSGNLLMRWNTPTHDCTWQSTSAVFTNGVNTHKVIRLRYDFTTDTFQPYVNGTLIPGSFTSGSFASATSSDYNPNQNFYVGGSQTSSSTTGTQTTSFFVTRFAITPLLSSGDIATVEAYMNFLPSGTSADFESWTLNEVNGFDATTVDDTLNLDGNTSGGYRDYLTYNVILPDTLEEFKVGYTFKISDALAANDAGTGPIITHDLTTEANYAAYALFVTDPTSSNFGRLQLYTGTGSVSETAFAFRSQTSNAFVPAQDSVYQIEIIRTIENNGLNVFYNARLIDVYYDTAILTTSYLETNAPSSDFIGTTTKVGIWQNGGPFKINPFYVVRVGDEDITPDVGGGGGGGGNPGLVTYEVFVTKSGNDSNACTEALPCLTVGRGAARVDELGAGTDMYIGPGTYVEGSFIFWSTDLDTLDGAGDTETIIKGASNLYSDIATSGNGSPFSSYGYLFNFSSASSTDDYTVLRNFTLEGNRDVGSYANSMKGGVRVDNRDLIHFDNVDVKYFWSVGIWTQSVDSLVYNGGHLYRNGFSNPIPAITYSLGNLECFGTNINIWVTNSLIDSPVFNEGRGLGHSGAPNFYRFDFHGHGNEFIVGGSSDSDGDHHFAFEFLQYFMNSGDSISFRDNLFRKNVSFNYTGTQAGIHYFEGNRFTFDLPKNLAIEAQGPNIIITNNYFSNCVGKVVGTYNGWGSGAPIPHCPRDCHAANQVWQGLTVTNNIIELVAGTISGDGVFSDQLWRRDDVLIENNTIRFTTTSGAIYRLVRGGTQGVNDNWIVQNNAIHGQPSSGSTVFSTANGSGTFTNSFFRYNKATNLNVLQTLAGGMTESNNTVTGSGNTLLFNLTGAKFPILQNSYYGWTTNAVLDGTGQSSSDIGAYEN